MASRTSTTLTKLDRGGEENDVQIVVTGGNISLVLDQLFSSCNQGLWDSLFSLSDLQCIGVIALADHGILTVGAECHSCWLNSHKLHGQPNNHHLQPDRTCKRFSATNPYFISSVRSSHSDGGLLYINIL